ncbi:Sad1/UNC domain protein [Metarhizium album ARSEF 1941]|uniref:Sad1/UNC domain protein n=1 Tax=Metarhizium album (strain ARSEF 1941) TaxID=1081103 RepID=A0A0B2X601_METAS|nr:Sad1/UNC domain protein [Metarhizium album ARSEF 1941]KHO00885.1 Sad1/UNC domain protein [Metarhizium album ARSEF 1941]
MVRAAIFARGLPAALFLAFRMSSAIHEPQVPRGANVTASLPPPVHPRSTTQEVCEARTINYITHALPQSCLTSSWTSPAPTSTASAVPQHARDDGSYHGTESRPPPPPTPTCNHNATEVQLTEPAATTFMSFEDWKEMMLRRAGQDPQDLRSRKPSEHSTDDRYSPESGHAGLGEEGEISLNFDDYGDGDHKKTVSTGFPRGDGVDEQLAGDALQHEEGNAATVHLSKDAGKTCKERFSYSSFDAGATILKTSPGAKNARAILVENKDTYMLLECDAASKYVIVELSDDISVDTVVLANFEFFSSMVRHFRVSVSDRYPVKMDKWRELGTFEARNSRDIQPFLVQNPQIWAKYVRIEFLTHFGNEYYCPISLIRIHGSRMLDSWKDSEGARDEEALIDDGDESGGADTHQGEEDRSDVVASGDVHAHVATSNSTSAQSLSYALDIFTYMNATCPASSSMGGNYPVAGPKLSSGGLGTSQEHAVVPSEASQARSASLEKSGNSSMVQAETVLVTASTNYSAPRSTSQDDRMRNNTGVPNGTAPNVNTTTVDREHNATTSTAKVSASSGHNGKPRISGTTGASAASPTMQEGFFNAITKRLQHVESNLTLSMKYVEDQSKHIQEALQSREYMQRAKISYYLDELNKTVLAELRTVREQYDQIWQSTVLALESQRDRSERDMMALSSRLNLLADEVVFQKRMAIIQAIILLSCLFLIIFSRGVSLPSFAPLLDQPSNSSSATSTSPGTSRQSSYRLSKGHHREGESSFKPPDPSRQAQVRCPDEARSDSSAQAPPFEAVPFHSKDEAEDECSVFQRLSPPPTPSLLGEVSLSSGSIPVAGSNHALPQSLGGTSRISSRKPLPSLPEHPRSLDEDES